MISPETEVLVSRLKARDSEAMEELYDRFSGLLYSQILRRVTYGDIAEDILQEVFFRIWNRISAFDVSQGTLTVWMVTIARNCAVDYLRTQRHTWPERKQVELNECHGVRWANGELTIQANRDIRRALVSLKRPQRQVLELAYFEGCSQTEIASQLERPLGTIKSLVRSAMKALRTNISPNAIG